MGKRSHFKELKWEFRERAIYRTVGRMKESSHKSWATQKKAQWEVGPALGMKGGKRRGENSVSWACSNWSCRESCYYCRNTGRKWAGKTKTCAPVTLCASASTSLDHPEPGRDVWPTQGWEWPQQMKNHRTAPCAYLIIQSSYRGCLTRFLP